MLRSMMQVYVKDSAAAVACYEKAFDTQVKNAHLHDDGGYLHAELDVYGQILALSEQAAPNAVSGNTMQFCLHFKTGDRAKIERAYDVLKEGATLEHPLGPTFYSDCMAALIDRFGVRWCLFEQRA